MTEEEIKKLIKEFGKAHVGKVLKSNMSKHGGDLDPFVEASSDYQLFLRIKQKD